MRLQPGHRHCAGHGGHRRFDEGRGGFFRGPLGGGGFRGGMRAAKMLGSAELQLIILRLLSEKPRHGYEIIKAVEEHSSGIYTPSPGMVYPALTYLEETAYAVAAAEGSKKLFSITAEGALHLEAQRAAADELWSELAIYGRKLAHFRRQFAEDEDVADHFGGGPRGTREEWRNMKAEFRALRDELKAAIYEKIEAPLEEKRRVLDILRRTVEAIRGKSA